MHDWTLVSILVDWKAARVTLRFRRPDAGSAEIVGGGLLRLDVPRRTEWGPSVSVNRVLGPASAEAEGQGVQRLAIEMQSGDTITVLATSFAMPEPMLDEAASLLPAAGK